MPSKYDTMPLQPDYLRNLELLAQSIDPTDRLQQLGFYCRAHDRIKANAQKNQMEFETLCAMVATMSPGLDLFQAEVYTNEIVKELISGKDIKDITLFGSYGWDNIRKSVEIYYKGAEGISGAKVVSLYNNILWPLNKNYVSIGKLEKRALTQDFTSSDEMFRISKYEYPWIVKHYQHVANNLSVVPCELQAIINFVVSKEIRRSNKELTA